MKLMYRGVSYNLAPAVETPQSEISGKYRGVFWRLRRQKKRGKFAGCDRCRFYSGDPHLLCAVHPDGPGGDRCPDFELDSPRKN
ncbi:DUF4278 domain-containing protein [Phormidium sp. CCY1219]|uniref:DUF4278 domain-containing protein n=1 Tax=Phormidium sp. CCY1219 TaxID=2886104 RepID=UPI002D1F797D|nr:DUF4278 domain-containing protein [Phormidium sp. CCY1219]MEB3828335.1 DUF4278 domain-containing protein [Phormidium sp. CCY1219]